jgi:hypothetical protein
MRNMRLLWNIVDDSTVLFRTVVVHGEMLWFCRVPVWAREKDTKIVEICKKFSRKCRVFFIIWRFPFPDVDQSTDCRHTPLPWMTPMLGRKVCHRHFWAIPTSQMDKIQMMSISSVWTPHPVFTTHFFLLFVLKRSLFAWPTNSSCLTHHKSTLCAHFSVFHLVSCIRTL